MIRSLHRLVLAAALLVLLAGGFAVVPVRALVLSQVTFGATPPHEAYQSEPAWSPDGSWLAFSVAYWTPGGFDPYLGVEIATPSGAAGPEFYPPIWIHSHPTWSRDGSRIAFLNGLQTGALWLAPVTDYNSIEAILLQGIAGPAWSPTDDRIAIESNGSIAIVPATGGAPQPLVVGGHNPAWSADGTKLAYDADGRIWVLDLATLVTAPITSGATTDAHPTWSPDGGWIAFTSRRSGSRALWVAAAGGGGAPIQLTSGATDDYDPAWSPDGDRIAFTSGRGGAGPHVWMASDLPDFTVSVQQATWSQMKALYRR